MLLEMLKDAFPMCKDLPASYYGAKKIVSDLGLKYEKIDACKNDCVIFYKELSEATECPVCGLSRWESCNKGGKWKPKKKPWKVLRYFPLKSRLQQLFMSTKTAVDMRWHHDKRVNDGVLRHLADAEAWKNFDRNHETFALETRNVRLGLASDGFNPFGDMNVNYNIWPVILFPYNLPPWICLKEPYSFISLLIPSPKSVGNDIDVYMRPLIDELKDLWENGVETYDASLKKNFQMRAAVMWTINDFPAYAYMSGWRTQGKLACPACTSETSHFSLKHGSKICYMGHRRFLPLDHKWHNQKAQFDGTIERKPAPKRPSGDNVLNQLRPLKRITFGIGGRKQEIIGHGVSHNWKKHSIFFELPYWRTLLLRHNVDVMHVEKNVFDSVIGTIMNLDGKTKDYLNARRDMEAMGIRHKLHPKDVDVKVVLPHACYTLTSNETKDLCQWLQNVKVPDGYSANISRCVNIKERKISGMKTHDCHVFLERLLPLVVRDLLPKHVSDALVELSQFFRELCSKVLRVEDLDRLENQIAVTLCKLERIFPPSFFDIMLHLPIHLAWEAKVGGPVQYRWMYKVERHLGKLKKYVRNKARPEGSIAEGYLANKCLTFCSRYLNDVDTKFNRPERNYDGGPTSSDTSKLSIFSTPGRPFGKAITCTLNDQLYNAATLYVLQNSGDADHFIQEHKNILMGAGVVNVDEVHTREFVTWVRERITKLYNSGNGQVTTHMLSLARGPEKRVTYNPGHNVNGFRIRTSHRDENKKTQNSGVMVRGEHQGDNVPYYGVLTYIVELHYTEGNKVVLFQCEWYNVREGIGYKRDYHGITTINTRRRLNTQEPFVLTSQATQVYYVNGIKDPTWSVVMETKPRNLYEMPADEEESYQEEETEQYNAYAHQVDNEDDEIDWNRNGVDDMIL